MEQKELREILGRVASGEISVDSAVDKIKIAPFEDIGIANIDHHRGVRQGTAEVVYGAGKTAEQIVKIVDALIRGGQKRVMITRLSQESAEIVSKHFDLFYEKLSKYFTARKSNNRRKN